MLSPRWRKIWCDLIGYRTRTLIVVMSITIGVFALGTMVAVQDILTKIMDKSWQEINPAHILLYTTPFQADLVQGAARIPAVAQAEGQKYISLRIKVREQWKTLVLHVYPEKLSDIKMNFIKPLQGAWPPGPKALFLDQASLDFMGAKIGEPLELKTSDDKIKIFTLVGSVHDSNQISPAIGNSIHGYVSFEALKTFNLKKEYDTLLLQVEGDSTDEKYLQQVARQVQEKWERAGHNVYYTELLRSDRHPARKFVDSLVMITGGLGLGALLLSGFLVFNSISAVLVQQIKQIGIMKAVGASRRQIASLYLVFVLMHGVAALFLAIPLAVLTSYALAGLAASNYNFAPPGILLSPRAMLIQLMVALLVPLGASLYPIWSGTSITVREAISAYGLEAASAKDLIQRTLEKIKILPRPMLLSLRNTFRRRGRLVMTIAALTLGGAIFISVMSVRDSLMLTTDDALEYFNYNLRANLSENYRIDKIQQVAQGLPGVVAAECWGYVSARLMANDGPGDSNSKEVTMVAPHAATKMLNPMVIEGRWLLPEDENAVVINSEVVKEFPGLKPGNKITLKIDNRKSTWTVVGIVRGLLVGPLVYTNYPYFSYVTHNVGRAASLQVKLRDDSPAGEQRAARILEQKLTEAGLKTRSISKTSDTRSQIKSNFSFLTSFLLAMALLMGLVGGLGLMGTMGINVVERTREIGVMRAIGASNRSIMQIFISEGISIGLMSWVLGTLLSLLISKPMGHMVGATLLNADLSYTFSVLGALLWLFIVVVVSAMASYLPARNASKVKVRQALAYE